MLKPLPHVAAAVSGGERLRLVGEGALARQAAALPFGAGGGGGGARGLRTTGCGAGPATPYPVDNTVYHPDDEVEDPLAESIAEVPAADATLLREISTFLTRVDQPFEDENLVLLAATHKSWLRIVQVEVDEEGEEMETWTGPPVHNDRLSYMGSTFAAATLTEYLFVRYPRMSGFDIKRIVGVLTGEMMATAARNVGFQHLIRGRSSAANPSDTPDGERIIRESFSAFFGAVLVDQGAAAANLFVLDMFVPIIDQVGVHNMVHISSDPCRQLFNLLLAENLPKPTYEVLKETGRLTHNPTFLVGAFSGDKKLSEGASYSIKKAKRESARVALRTHYAQEFGEGDLDMPSNWGDYGVADTKEYIRDNSDPAPKGPEA